MLAAIAISLLVGAYLVRRSLEHNAFEGLQRQVALLARGDVEPAPGQFGRFLATQDERLSVLPKKQARLLLPDSPKGRITISGREYLYATTETDKSVSSSCAPRAPSARRAGRSGSRSPQPAPSAVCSR